MRNAARRISYNPQIVAEIQRFIIVSGVALMIDIGVYFILSSIFGMDSSWAKRISFACIPVWGFFAHKRFTFRKRPLNPGEPTRFALVYFAGLILNSVVHDATATLNQPSTPAFLAATIAWACMNFVGQKWFVFNSRFDSVFEYSKARNSD